MQLLDRGETILNIRISDTSLPNRAKRCLSRAQVQTVGQLILRTEDDLLSLRNFAETSLTAVKRYLEHRGLALAPDRQSPCKTEWVIDALEDPTFELMDRDRLILKLRHGIEEGPALTLEQVGKQLNLTRERVRQLQKAAEHRITCRSLFIKPKVAELVGDGISD